jgi:hypothetical protein
MGRCLNIYIIHAKWLHLRTPSVERFTQTMKKYAFESFDSVRTVVVDEYDPADIDASVVMAHVKYEPIGKPSDDETGGADLSFYNAHMTNMHISQVSNALKHRLALQRIAEGAAPEDVNMIVEDDVLHDKDVCLRVDRMFAEGTSAYPSGAVCFLGLPSSIPSAEQAADDGPKFQDTKELFRVLPYCDSYVLDKAAAERLLSGYSPVRFANHIQLSYALDVSGTPSVTAVPNVFMDGSKYGTVLSTLNPNNRLVLNADYMKLWQMMSTTPTGSSSSSSCADEEIETLIAQSPLNAHPDFLALMGLYYARKDRIEDSLACHEKAYEAYQKNGCILNHQSEFLKQYIRLHKRTQTENST